MNTSLRSVVGAACARWYRVRSRNRISGGPFLIGRPSRIKIERGGLVRIGRGVVIEKGARIVVRSELVIEDQVYIGKNATIIAFDRVHIGARTLIGENASIHSEDHGPVGRREDYSVSPVDIGADAWIGAGVVVTRGCRIGARTTVGANAVVTHDLPEDAVAVGLPARVIRSSGDR